MSLENLDPHSSEQIGQAGRDQQLEEYQVGGHQSVKEYLEDRKEDDSTMEETNEPNVAGVGVD